MALLVIVGSLQDGSAPFSKQPLRHSLDARLWLPALGVKQYHFADPAAQQCFLFNVQLRQCHENVALNVISRQRSVVEWLKKELDVLQKVCIGVKHGVLHIVSVENCMNLREQLELVQRRLARLASGIVCKACSFHFHLELRQQLVHLIFEVLVILLANYDPYKSHS